MKKHLVVGVALSLFLSAGATKAAARPKARVHNAPMATPVYNWTGFYVGLNAGYAFGHDPVDPVVNAPACDTASGCVPLLALLSAGQSMNPSRFTGGVQGGYNYQFNNVVAGLESDINYFRLSGSYNYGPTSTSARPNTASGGGSVTTNWLLTVRPRVGLVVDHLLAYVTGGLALTDQSNSDTSTIVTFARTNATIGTFNLSSSGNVGWVIGGGLEYAWTDKLSVKAEYQHIDFGSHSTTSGVVGGIGGFEGSTMTTTSHLTADIVRAGINYRLGWINPVGY